MFVLKRHASAAAMLDPGIGRPLPTGTWDADSIRR